MTAAGALIAFGDTRAAVIVRLRQRDGDACWLCGLPTTDRDRTIEHLLARTHGGNDDLANLCLTHGDCNQRLNDLPIVRKVEQRDEIRRRIASRRRQ